ncbi:MAG: metal-dependent transcriptional regulator, partial [Methanobacteriaceae archaeon]
MIKIIKKKDLEDYLKNLWLKQIENNEMILEKDFENDYITELFKKGFINIDNGQIILTESGKHSGQELVRKHRLAEKVISDLFLADMDETEALAHEIEHIMSNNVEENICKILGHPEECPHENPIPYGDCCEDFDKKNSKPLIKCDNGFFGEIAYIKTQDGKKLQKIMNLGILPGSMIQIIQKFPAYVFQLGNTQLAVD